MKRGGGVTDVVDSFNRADNATTLGTADSGHVWTSHAGTWGIATNQAREHASTGGYAFATVDSGRASFTAQVTLAVATDTEFPGIVFSFTDPDNALWAIADATTLYLQKREAAVTTTLSSVANALANGQVLKVTRSGSAIEVFINGVSKLTSTSGFNSSVTRHGLFLLMVIGTSRFDDFSVRV